MLISVPQVITQQMFWNLLDSRNCPGFFVCWFVFYLDVFDAAAHQAVLLKWVPAEVEDLESRICLSTRAAVMNHRSIWNQPDLSVHWLQPGSSRSSSPRCTSCSWHPDRLKLTATKKRGDSSDLVQFNINRRTKMHLAPSGTPGLQ